MSTLKITMLGASGVGKTSLLTAMYEQFNSTIGPTNLQLTPDPESAAILSEHLGDLIALFDNFEVTPGLGVAGTEQIRSFSFGIGKKGSKASLQLDFVDYPGGYIAANATRDRRQEVYDLLNEAAVVLIAIDAPALMEEGGKWNEKVNRTHQITDMFREAYQDLSYPRLVLFAPIKCEKYVKDNQSATNLRTTIKEKYSNLFSLFTSENLGSNVAVVITPVQTLGSIIFSRVEIKNNAPYFCYRKIRHDAAYSPKDSEQPLRYLLRFLIKLHYEEKSQSWGMFSFLRQWFALDSTLRDAVSTFVNGCKDSGGFEVVQGYGWLNI